MQVDAGAHHLELLMDGGYNGKTCTQHALSSVEGGLVTGFIISASGKRCTLSQQHARCSACKRCGVAYGVMHICSTFA